MSEIIGRDKNTASKNSILIVNNNSKNKESIWTKWFWQIVSAIFALIVALLAIWIAHSQHLN